MSCGVASTASGAVWEEESCVTKVTGALHTPITSTGVRVVVVVVEDTVDDGSESSVDSEQVLFLSSCCLLW